MILFSFYLFSFLFSYKEKATKWKNEKGELDGVTTNGVLIMHPEDGFQSPAEQGSKQQQHPPALAPEWMEVSVCGAVFSLNESRLTPSFQLNQPNSKRIAANKTNVLRDGTLIDLCGATLLWRSVDGLRQTPSKHYLEMNLQNLNRLKPQCPVGFKTLIFPSSVSTCQFGNEINNNENNLRINSLMKAAASKNMERTPMVYLMCGHVHGHHNWGIKKDNQRECPLCRKVSFRWSLN
jgi:pellino protein